MIPYPTSLTVDPVFASDVKQGLSRAGQRDLPSKYLYDAVGSALFEAITFLPEYGLTRADERVMGRLSPELPEQFSSMPLIAELGSGSGRKTKHILKAFAGRGKVQYFPIDVSAAALVQCRNELSSVAQVIPLENTYLDGLHAAASRRRPGQPMLVLFLGSTIGNFDPVEAHSFLQAVRGCCSPGDALLIGADLVKAPSQMIVAYDDPTGVTAAFNRNVLARINRELDGNFALTQFAHEARYDARCRRIEMHLRALSRQRVSVAGAEVDCVLQEGETIWTESSYKFDLAELGALARACGFSVERQWVDREWPFAEALWSASLPVA